MRVSFKDVLYGVATRLGLQPETGLLSDSAAALTRYLQHRVEEAWDVFAWPWAVVGEERNFAPAFSALDAEDVFAGDVVWHEGAYWEALGDAPVSSPAVNSEWKVATGFDRVIPDIQPGKGTIGFVLEIYDRNPRVYADAVLLPFTLVADGTLCRPDAPDTVWVIYQKPAPLFSGIAWDPAVLYSQGTVVYAAEQGDCFVCRQAHQGVTPPTTLDITAKWERQSIARELRAFLELAAFSDALAEDGAHDKARAAEARAQEALARQMEKIAYRQGQARGFGVLVRAGAN